MDSLTQIVLGAACAEAALGKKIGNKALMFGAIGGTIPDLDVFVGNWMYGNQIDAMLFHRGFMHSMTFAILAAFLLGLLVYKLYDTGKRKDLTTQKDWTWLFFLSIFTHPILDCFTGYGTQLFLPFSDYRVAFSNISVADPTYTVPFLLCLIVMMFFNRKNPTRRLWLKLGFGISSIYMLFTIGNKFYINSVFEKSLAEQGITYQRYNTEPSILNNVLWFGIAETETEYHVAFYSLFDTKNVFIDWEVIPKTHDLIPKSNPDLASLAWFSNDYYNLSKNEDGTYIYSDLRYPSIDTGNGKSAVFSFKIYKDGDRLNMKPFQPEFDENMTLGDVFGIFWERIKGK
ncbi:metal-dependent hydrolase [Kordia sp. YSTF-M3]|uniref:Metal-dependent hydrolase n=1 Tax=Kordia aestuariivivens TaxID=2759037 RepID=A0ABR7QF83_9FLAO|nr:metal-dependent hydrolase [Kordia aestuariivivens]MBC8757194.1 metal-dependent hydrolase [Kordia aestuariivivens]